MYIPRVRILKIVTMKLIDAASELIPAKWSEKIERSTDASGWYSIDANGGYKVQPVPAPSPVTAEDSNVKKDHGKIQNDRAFNRGKAISGAPIKIGTNQLPKPPIITGITMKKIIIMACAVTNEL